MILTCPEPPFWLTWAGLKSLNVMNCQEREFHGTVQTHQVPWCLLTCLLVFMEKIFHGMVLNSLKQTVLGWSARSTFSSGLLKRRLLLTVIALILTHRRSTGMVWACQESLWLLTGDSCSFDGEKTPFKIPGVASCGSRIIFFVIVHLMVTFRAVVHLGAVIFTIGNGAVVIVIGLGLHVLYIDTLTLTWLLQYYPVQCQEALLWLPVLTTQMYKTAFRKIKSPSGLRATPDPCLSQHVCWFFLREAAVKQQSERKITHLWCSSHGQSYCLEYRTCCLKAPDLFVISRLSTTLKESMGTVAAVINSNLSKGKGVCMREIIYPDLKSQSTTAECHRTFNMAGTVSFEGVEIYQRQKDSYQIARPGRATKITALKWNTRECPIWILLRTWTEVQIHWSNLDLWSPTC